jgi:hypothetical protein
VSLPRESEAPQKADTKRDEPPITPLPELELEMSVESVEDTLAARRAKRQAILAKYKEQQQPNSAATLPPDNSAISNAPSVSQPQPTNNEPNGVTDEPERSSATPQPTSFELVKDGDDTANQVELHHENGGDEQVFAADYDPSLDRREDEQRRFHDAEPMNVVEEVEEVFEEVEVEEVVEDMFAAEPIVRKVMKTKRVAVSVYLSRLVVWVILRHLRKQPPPPSSLRLWILQRIRRATILSSSASSWMEDVTRFSLPLAKECLPMLFVRGYSREIHPNWARRSLSR